MFTSSVKAQEITWNKGPLGLFGKRYGLAVQVIIDNLHPLEKEMQIINEHYINWHKRRGKDCHDLILAFTAHRSSKELILSQCQRLLMQDVGDEKTLAAMDIDLVIVDSQTKEATEHKLKWSPHGDPLPTPTSLEKPLEVLGINGPNPGQVTLLFGEEGAGIASGIEEARRRLPEFKALLESPQAGVSVRVPWVYGDLREIYEAGLVGRNGDEIEVEFTPDYAPGPIRKKYRFEDILDWTVHHQDGTTSGGFTMRTALQKQLTRRKASGTTPGRPGVMGSPAQPRLFPQ